MGRAVVSQHRPHGTLHFPSAVRLPHPATCPGTRPMPHLVPSISRTRKTHQSHLPTTREDGIEGRDRRESQKRKERGCSTMRPGEGKITMHLPGTLRCNDGLQTLLLPLLVERRVAVRRRCTYSSRGFLRTRILCLL